MRGSIYYQTSILTKLIFSSGTKKEERKNEDSEHYKFVSSFKTMESYRKIWNDIGHYMIDVFGLKDLERIKEEHLHHYMFTKIFQGISHQYLQKISSAIGKLEFALEKFSARYDRGNSYDFSIRMKIVKESKKFEFTHNNYRDRAYEDPERVIRFLKNRDFQLAASIQLFGGARAEGVCLIESYQLQGLEIDEIAGRRVGVIQTREKGGKIGYVRMSVQTYAILQLIISDKGVFKIDYRRYVEAIKRSCALLGIISEGTHGLRWNFAQRRFQEYLSAGYSDNEALQMVSYEMKHMRPDITCHYVGK